LFRNPELNILQFYESSAFAKAANDQVDKKTSHGIILATLAFLLPPSPLHDT
jgi:hypothetical protein